MERAPFASGDLDDWLEPQLAVGAVFALDEPMPLVGVDRAVGAGSSAAEGLGLPEHILAPTPTLAVLLRLRSTGRFVLHDDLSAALALITWRTGYEHSAYHLSWPRITGCALVLRPDLMGELARRAPAPLAIREYLAGNRHLAESRQTMR